MYVRASECFNLERARNFLRGAPVAELLAPLPEQPFDAADGHNVAFGW